MGGQRIGETMGCGILARIGTGVNPDAMRSKRVDGINPLARDKSSNPINI